MTDNTPSARRLHIVLTGRCNSGKSSLLNAITAQDVAIVSSRAGTTTDAVRKPMELPGAGACVLVDTPGLDDGDELGALRIGRARAELSRADIVIALLDDDTASAREMAGILASVTAPVIYVLSRADRYDNADAAAASISDTLSAPVIPVSAHERTGLTPLLEAIARAAATDEVSITGELTKPGDTVILVMPQDPQAPSGRLILPQVQTLRELLDRNCTAICCVPPQLGATLSRLNAAPSLVITDSQVFKQVADTLPAGIPLTSFSVLMAGYKGDINLFVSGSEALARLNAGSRVLIAEACTHAPQTEDIGRVKIPRLLRRLAGDGITIDITGGADFPDDLTGYDLIVHCGGCMFTRRHVMSRIARARAAGVPVTNYGILLARAAGILPRVTWPGKQ